MNLIAAGGATCRRVGGEGPDGIARGMPIARAAHLPAEPTR